MAPTTYTGMKIVIPHKLIGKFFSLVKKERSVKAGSRMTREFRQSLHDARYGLAGCHHHVVRPLGRNYSMNAFWSPNTARPAAQRSDNGGDSWRDHGKLYHKLTALAYFLASFHNRTAIALGRIHQDCEYMDRLIGKLLKLDTIGWDEARRVVLAARSVAQ